MPACLSLHITYTIDCHLHLICAGLLKLARYRTSKKAGKRFRKAPVSSPLRVCCICWKRRHHTTFQGTRLLFLVLMVWLSPGLGAGTCLSPMCSKHKHKSKPGMPSLWTIYAVICFGQDRKENLAFNAQDRDGTEWADLGGVHFLWDEANLCLSRWRE